MITFTKSLFTSLALVASIAACGSEGTGAPGGGAGASTGAGGGAGPTATGSIVLDGGYYANGAFKGYLYTAAGDKSTITPPCGTGSCFGANACVSGSVPKVSSATAYSAEWGALVGWNISQEKVPPNPIGTTVLDGKTINVALAVGASPLPAGMRVKVAVAGVDYCAALSGATASVPASSLKKECWTPGGSGLPAGALVDAIAIQVTSDGSANKTFDFCIAALSID
jgi:hypothetical protein